MWYLFPAHDTLVGRFSDEPVIVAADSDNNTIWKVNVRGQEKVLLASSPGPQAVLALPRHGVVLWSSKNNSNIMQLQGEGSAAELVSGVNDAVALGYVEAEDLLVWVTYGSRTLESSKRDGSQRKTIRSLDFTPSDLVVVGR